MKMNRKSRKYYPVENPFKFSIRIYLRAKSIKHHLPWRPTLQDAIADRERVLALKNDMSVSVFRVEEEIMAVKRVLGTERQTRMSFPVACSSSVDSRTATVKITTPLNVDSCTAT